jgi:ferredoxin/flavodoxin
MVEWSVILRKEHTMELLILYYSGTGNTKFACQVAKLAAERMGHDVTMRAYEEAGELTLSAYDAYCFAAPLQAWQPTRNVERYIKSMPRLDGKYAFILTSSGGIPSQAHALMARWLKKKGVTAVGSHDLKCPDSWPITRGLTYKHDEKRPDTESVRELVRFTEKMLLIQIDLLEGKAVELPRYRVIPTPFFWISRFERMSKGRPDLAMGKKKVIESECTQCEICAKQCPAGAIRLDPYPIFSMECIYCWRCVNNCPEDCITTRVDNRRRHYKGFKHGQELLKAVGLDKSQPLDSQQ